MIIELSRGQSLGEAGSDEQTADLLIQSVEHEIVEDLKLGLGLAPFPDFRGPGEAGRVEVGRRFLVGCVDGVIADRAHPGLWVRIFSAAMRLWPVYRRVCIEDGHVLANGRPMEPPMIVDNLRPNIVAIVVREVWSNSSIAAGCSEIAVCLQRRYSA